MNDATLGAGQWRDISRFWGGLAEFSVLEFEEALAYVADELRSWLGGSHMLVVVHRRIAPRDSSLDGFRPIFFRGFGPYAATRRRLRREWMSLESNLAGDPAVQDWAAGIGRRRVVRRRGDLESGRRMDTPLSRLLESLELQDRLAAVMPVNRRLEVSYCIDRPAGASPFTRADADLLGALLDGLGPLSARLVHRNGLMVGQRRLKAIDRRVLDGLLGAQDEADIAADADMSVEHLGHIAEQLYQKLGVADRLGLMALWTGSAGESGASTSVVQVEAKQTSFTRVASVESASAQRVRVAIDGALSDGELNLAAVAGRLGSSGRHLQNQLRSTNVSFGELADQARRERAELLLALPWVNLGEVAFQIGYQQPSSFNRAVKRWTGMTPGQFQKG